MKKTDFVHWSLGIHIPNVFKKNFAQPVSDGIFKLMFCFTWIFMVCRFAKILVLANFQYISCMNKKELKNPIAYVSATFFLSFGVRIPKEQYVKSVFFMLSKKPKMAKNTADTLSWTPTACFKSPLLSNDRFAFPFGGWRVTIWKMSLWRRSSCAVEAGARVNRRDDQYWLNFSDAVFRRTRVLGRFAGKKFQKFIV